MEDVLQELRTRLQEAAAELRAGDREPQETLALIEECSRLAGEVSQHVETDVRAALEPLPHLPGQLPLPAA
jgi:hypothetical protein